MRQVDSAVDRLLILLRNKILENGFTQLDVQQALGWGRSYISQLLAKQKKIRIEQVLLILDVIHVDAAEFFAELYAAYPPYTSGQPVPPTTEPVEGEDRLRELRELEALAGGLVALLLERRLITDDELVAAIEAARLE